MKYNTDDAHDYGIQYTEQVICEKPIDISIVSDSFFNQIKNSIIYQGPILYKDTIIKKP